MRALVSRLFGRNDAPADPGPLVPEALALAINSAQITARGVVDVETQEPRVSVMAEGLGWWEWRGTDDAAARIARRWSGTSPDGARVAARLLARVIASRLQVSRPRARAGFVFDWADGLENVK